MSRRPHTLTGRDPALVPNGEARPRNGKQIHEQAWRRGSLERPLDHPDIFVSDMLTDECLAVEDSTYDASELDLQRADQVEREARLLVYELVVLLEEEAPERGYEHAVRLLREVREMRHGPAQRTPLTSETRFLVYRRDGYQCVECGEHEIYLLTIDHVVPVVLGGTNDPENLRTLCRSCNSAKGGRL